MKALVLSGLVLLIVSAMHADVEVIYGDAQITYVFYDQVSYMPEGVHGGAAWPLNVPEQYRPGQSFTPWSPFIDFIDLGVGGSQSQGGSVYVVLRSDSITGPIIASTDPIAIPPGGSSGWTRFIFPSRVEIRPDETYYFQPVLEPGGCAYVVGYNMTRYTAGRAFFGTQSQRGMDMFFREGRIETVAVPEPSTAVLVLSGLFVSRLAVRRKRA